MNKIIIFLYLILPLSSLAQSPDEEAAKRFDAPRLQERIGSMQIIPFFLKKSNKFWFKANPAALAQDLYTVDQSKTENKKNGSGFANDITKTNNSSPLLNGINTNKDNYYLVDPDQKQMIELFDKKAIFRKLRELTKLDIRQAMVTYSPKFSADERFVEVGYDGNTYHYNFTTKTLLKQDKNENQGYSFYESGNKSPDEKWLIYARHHNLYLRKTADTSEKALSSDGAQYHSFSINDKDDYANTNSQTDAVWTPDSKAFYVLRKDTRKVQTLTLINSAGNFNRPLVSTYKYELPGDKNVAQYDFYIGIAGSDSIRKINIDRWPDQEVELLRNQSSNKEVFLLRKKRSRDEIELCAVNLKTGELRIIINEISKPFINQELFNVSIINDGKDILWWSDRTGWGHYYHYDGNGQLLNLVSSGNWTAGKIMATDTAKRVVYFYGYGKETGRNPNYAFLYKAGFNGGKPQLLTPEDATHSVYFSPSKKFLVDNYSRIDLEPKSIVRETSGNYVQEVWKPDLAELYAYGWKKPEMFTVKARDGITDLYGLMWKPFNFDPNKKYPIISQVYPGPFTETVWSEFTVTDRYNNTSLAQIGFIVVVMGHRGGSPFRSAKYYKFGYGNLRDYALEDDKFGIEQLASNFKYIDPARVGIYGHSGGGAMSTTAICTYPDFYKVAVSSSGNHDNRLYNRTWGETYNGYGNKIDINQSLAKKLKGHLLLVTGESDQNVNPGATYKMVNELIKQDKDFDLLVLPGQGHDYEGQYKSYFQKRVRQYFSRHLLK